jgi:hypothetical protein
MVYMFMSVRRLLSFTYQALSQTWPWGLWWTSVWHRIQFTVLQMRHISLASRSDKEAASRVTWCRHFRNPLPRVQKKRDEQCINIQRSVEIWFHFEITERIFFLICMHSVHEVHKTVSITGEIMSVRPSTCFISETTQRISIKFRTGSVH